MQVYGLQGVVLAHVFLNLPLATRMFLQGWQAIPAERFRLAASLGFTPADVARHLERPMLREVAPGALATVFAICLTSFAVALVLGGGRGRRRWSWRSFRRCGSNSTCPMRRGWRWCR